MKSLSKKNAILLSAVKVFAKTGFEKATVDEIAEKAKVAKGTVYYYFKSKEEVFNAILGEGIIDFDKKIGEAVLNGKNAVEKLNILIDTENSYISMYQDFFTVFMGELIKKARRFEEIEKVIEQGRKEKIFRKDLDTKFVATALFWMVAMTTISGQIESQKEMVLKGITV